MTNRRNARRRLSRLTGEALIHGGHLQAGLHACIKPMVEWLNSENTLVRALRRSRAQTARKNYHETGSATRWGTCRRTATPTWEDGEPIYWPLNESLPPYQQP